MLVVHPHEEVIRRVPHVLSVGDRSFSIKDGLLVEDTLQGVGDVVAELAEPETKAENIIVPAPGKIGHPDLGQNLVGDPGGTDQLAVGRTFGKEHDQYPLEVGELDNGATHFGKEALLVADGEHGCR